MKPLPEGLPPLPEGAVYLGKGGEYRRICGWFNGWYCDEGGRWIKGMWPGSGKGHYAAPADSEIARLNRQDKPSWGCAPEWAECIAQEPDGEWWWLSGGDFITTEKGRFKPGFMRSQKAAQSKPNPNWRETLERRPEMLSECHADGEPIHVLEPDDPDPDLIIPKDAADAMCGYSWVEELADAGYRLEIDSNGIRGWKEDSE